MTWRRAAELLEDREYEQVAQLLQEKQEAVQLAGQMNLVILLAAACQLCLTCRHFRAERELHQQSFEDADRRERELRKQLATIVEILSLNTPLDADALGETTTASTITESFALKQDKPKGLLQKIQERLGLEPSPLSTQGSRFIRFHEEESVEKTVFAPVKEGDPQEIVSVDATDWPGPRVEKETQPLQTPEEAPPQTRSKERFEASFPKSEDLSNVDQELLALTARLTQTYLSDRRKDRDTSPAGPSTEVTDPDADELKTKALSSPEEQSAEVTVSLEALPKRDTHTSDQPEIEISLAAAKSSEEPSPTREVIPDEPKRYEQASMAHPDHPVKPESPTLTVYCLGPFRVYQDDQLITSWSGLKGQSILKYLIAHHARPISKDMLMEVFWPDADPKSARRNLHQAIYSLRQILRGEQPDFQHVRFEDGFYYLNPMMDIWLDFVEFESQVQTGLQFEAEGQSAAAIKAYGAAEGLYLGDFMDEDIYERWPEVQRENLRNKYLEITDRLAQYYMEQGEFIAGAALSRKLLSKDNCHEGAHRRLMQCYMAQGQRHLAVRQYQTCIQTLQEELDIGPSEETTALYRRI